MASMEVLVLLAALSGVGETVLLDFSATWCEPCRTMEPAVGRLAAAGYPVRKVDVDQQPDLARRFGVDVVPCFVMLRDGQVVDRVEGATSHARLERMFEKAGYRPGQSTGEGRSSRIASGRSQPINTSARDRGGPRTGSQTALSPQQRAMQATVRLRIEDAGGYSVGTGTIIDTHGEEALVLTCGHLFRDSQGKGRIEVDVFAQGSSRPVVGQLIAYDADKRDVGLVSIRPGVPVIPVPVASPDYQVRQGDPVFSVGCDRGADPSLRQSQVSAVDRYLGPSNLEVTGQPVDGRSGGGLFSKDGVLIGVCNAADPAEAKGIYAAAPSVHWQLKEIGQERIFLAGNSAPATNPVATPRQDMPRSAPQLLNQAPPTEAISSVPSRPMEPLVPVRVGNDPGPDVRPAGRTTNPPLPQNAEVICIVRSRDPRGESRVLVLDRASPALLEQLTRESRQQLSLRRGETPDLSRLANQPRRDVVRAQSER